MTALHKHPPAPRAKPTTHSQPRAGHDWSAGPWKHAPQPIKTPWLESNLALMILCAVVCAITWVAADHVWTALTLQPGVVWE